MAVNPSRLEVIFDEAVAIDDPEQRRAYLDSTCGDDPDLRSQVESLLEADAQAGEFLSRSPLESTASAELAFFEPGDHVGRYELRQWLGEGGCGVVYLARQQEPVQRRVAVKLIKPGMDSKQIVARFEAERQALAMMDHRHIAHVYDAGATDHGRPYVVMELVEGPPITTYCDQQRLDVRQRLRLFADVCAAVQHAHQKGIIHRDLKPTNILVAEQDGEAVVKVIDFGIAKAIDQELTQRTLVTQARQLIGTPIYMSPEQAAPGSTDIDTRSDIYGLGAVLYELLAGSPPFQESDFAGRDDEQVRRLMRETDPPRPSARLAAPRDQARPAAGRRPENLRELRRMLQGDLDWIVMKAIEKDRSRRYATANAMAMDIRRYLDGAPVEARPPGAVYRLRKFVHRNRVAAGAGAVIVLALVAGLVLATVGLLRAEQAAIRAQTLLAQTQISEGVDRLEAGDSLGFFGLVQAARTAEQVPDLQQAAAQLWIGWDAVTERRLEHVLPGGSEAAFSPDGSAIATTTRTGAIHLRDVNTGEPLTPTMHHGEGPVPGVAFSPSGDLLATAGWDGTLRVWDVQTGEPRTALLGESQPNPAPHLYPPRAPVAFSPDGKFVSGWSMDGAVRVWETATGTLHGEFGHHADRIRGLAFSADGTYLATVAGPEDGRALRVWRVADGEMVMPPADSPGRVQPLHFQPGRNRLAVTSWGEARLIDVPTGETVGDPLTPPGDAPDMDDLAFSPDGRYLAIAHIDWTVRLWDLESSATSADERVLTIRHEGRVSSVAFSPDGRQLASGSVSGIVRVHDVRTGEPVGPPLRHAGPVRRVRFSPEGDTLATAAADGQTRLWQVNPPSPGRALAHPEPPRAVAFSPDSATLWTGAGQVVRRWNLDAGRAEGPVFTHPGDIWSISASPDGRHLLIGGSDGSAARWSLADGRADHEPMTSFTDRPEGGIITTTAFSPDGDLMATAGYDGRVHLWDRQTGERAGEPLDVGHTVQDIDFSPDGSRLAIAEEEQRAPQIWSVQRRERIATLPADDRTYSIAYHPEGDLLVTASMSGELRLWDAWTHEPLGPRLPHPNPLRAAAFSQDGTYLAVVGDAGTARLYVMTDEPPYYAIRLPLGEVDLVDVAFSPDGRLLATVGLDGRVTIWPLAEPPSVERMAAANRMRFALTRDEDRGLAAVPADAWQADRAGQQREASATSLFAAEQLQRHDAMTDSLRSILASSPDSAASAEQQLQALAEAGSQPQQAGHDESVVAEAALARAILARRLGEAGQLDDAFTLLDDPAAVIEQSRDTAVEHVNRVGFYAGLSSHDRHTDIAEAVLASRRRVRPADHPLTLTAEQDLAWSHYNADRLDEARPRLEDVFDRRRRVLGLTHIDTGVTAQLLASTYNRLGEHAKAVELLTRTLPDRERLDPAERIHRRMLDNLAINHAELGEHDQAARWWQRLRELQTTALGPDHHATLETRLSIGQAYAHVGRHEQARHEYETILADSDCSRGDACLLVLRAGHSLGVALGQLKAFDRAIEQLEQTRERMAAALGETHHRTLDAMRALALTHATAGEATRSLALLEGELELIHQRWGDDAPRAAAVASELARLYIDHPQLPDAKVDRLREVLAHQRQARTEALQLAELKANLAHLLLHRRQYAAAEPLARASLATRVDALDPEDWRTASSRSLLGWALLGQEKTDQAHRSLNAAYPVLRNTLGEDHTHTTRTREQLDKTTNARQR